jgi:hypothetical protein
MTSWTEFGRQVEQRAVGRCEYCKMHQTLQGATFHVEHYCIKGLTPVGQGTVESLALNHERRMMIRQAEAGCICSATARRKWYNSTIG